MKTHFTIVFEDRDERDEALELLKRFDYVFDDKSYVQKYVIFLKVERSFEIRQVGKFRHHFHEALDNHFKALGSSEEKYKEGNWKLHWSSGQIFLNIENDDHLLMTFSRGIPKYTSEIEANYPILQKYHLTNDQSDRMIGAALVKAEAAKV